MINWDKEIEVLEEEFWVPARVISFNRSGSIHNIILLYPVRGGAGKEGILFCDGNGKFYGKLIVRNKEVVYKKYLNVIKSIDGKQFIPDFNFFDSRKEAMEGRSTGIKYVPEPVVVSWKDEDVS